jgi:hypothetical protein
MFLNLAIPKTFRGRLSRMPWTLPPNASPLGEFGNELVSIYGENNT